MTSSTDSAQGPDRIWIDPEYIDSKRTTPVLACNLGTANPDRKLNRDVEYIRANLATDPLGAVKVKPLEWDDSGAVWVAWDDVKEYVVYAENREDAERVDSERAARIRSALDLGGDSTTHQGE